jgi:hypothetical protein
VKPWDLDSVATAFADAAPDPALWVKAMDTIASQTESVGALLFPLGGAVPNVPMSESVGSAAETFFREGWYLRDHCYRGVWTHTSAALMTPVRLPRQNRRPILAYPIRLSAVTACALADCQAMLVLVDLENRVRPPQEALHSSFGLTPAEARLAIRMASGSPLERTRIRLGSRRKPRALSSSPSSRRPASAGRPSSSACWRHF